MKTKEVAMKASERAAERWVKPSCSSNFAAGIKLAMDSLAQEGKGHTACEWERPEKCPDCVLLATKEHLRRAKALMDNFVPGEW